MKLVFYLHSNGRNKKKKVGPKKQKTKNEHFFRCTTCMGKERGRCSVSVIVDNNFVTKRKRGEVSGDGLVDADNINIIYKHSKLYRSSNQKSKRKRVNKKTKQQFSCAGYRQPSK